MLYIRSSNSNWNNILYNIKNEYTLLTNEIIESLNEASNNIDGAFNTNDLLKSYKKLMRKLLICSFDKLN